MPAQITFTRGDILESGAEALVNTVNCVGIMGRGVALQFKNAFPANFEAYAGACRREEVRPGRMFVYDTGRLAPPRYIVNFPTKRHWRGKSRMEDIDSGLMDLADVVRTRRIRSVALPPLGSGLGGLHWGDVRARIERALRPLDDVRVVIYEPDESVAASRITPSSNVPRLTPGRAVLVELMHRYLAGLLDPFISLLEIHKLTYFMQESGEPMRLAFVEAPYGPYAENLRHVLQKIEGHLIAGYADGGDSPAKLLTLVPGAAEDATSFLREHAQTRARFDRVSALIEGFESPLGLELLATVHWVVTRKGVKTTDEVVHATYDWGPRKRQFTARQIVVAQRAMFERGWLREPEADTRT
jgi:O-acetyl-ADP-ribose deacetylase (regulator of RNase III)